MADRPLQILYVGPGDRGSCKARREALERLGHKLTVINYHHYLDRLPSILSKIEMKTQYGLAIRRFNHDILRATGRESFDWMWVDKGTFLFPSTVKSLRRDGLFIVHHTTDDVLNSAHCWRHYKKALLDYHVHLTSNIFNVIELRDLGVEFAILTHLGFDPTYCFYDDEMKSERDSRYSGDVIFIGHWEPETEQMILHLVENDVDVKVWGTNWQMSPNRHRFGEKVIFRELLYPDYAEAIASAKIALAFLSKANRNGSTMRSFEIPAIGTFMLGERTGEHLSFYEEGQEAEFFSSPEELLEKTRYYLKNGEARRRIALAGHRRAMTSGYTFFDRIKQDLANIMPIYIKHSATRSIHGIGDPSTGPA